MANTLSKWELGRICQVDAALKNHYDKAKDGEYRVGDVLVEEWWYHHSPTKVMRSETSRKAIRKYVVVHVSSTTGIPYIKELNAKGKATGRLLLPHRLDTIDRRGVGALTDNSLWGVQSLHGNHRYALDTSQLDAILLDQDFDPTEDARRKNQVWNDVNKHNKKLLVDTHTDVSILNFIKNLKPGDKFWASTTTFYVVQNVFMDDRGGWCVNVLDKNQAATNFSNKTMKRRRIYSDQPRSYTKESKD